MSAPVPISLRARWQRPEPSLGLWHHLPVPRASEIAGRSGFDWLCIDAQHGPFGGHEVESMLAAIAPTATPAIVRVPWHDPGAAMKALDAGAHGILFPVIRRAEEAAALIQACRHPPHGYRSWAGRGLGAEAPARADALIACGVMIETCEAIVELDAILAIDGLDFVFVGPDDLAISHGLPPSLTPTDPDLVRTIEDVAARCADRGIAAGIYCGTPVMATRWAQTGFRILATTADDTVLREGLTDVATRMRAAVAVRD
jgi:4-hydroxy-2-oxoheptanedioate aldolase